MAPEDRWRVEWDVGKEEEGGADFHLSARRTDGGFVRKPCSRITRTTAEPTVPPSFG